MPSNPNQGTIDQINAAIAQMTAAKSTLATDTAATVAQYNAAILQVQAASAAASAQLDTQIAMYRALVTALGG